jgi:hypothetical protein
MFIYNCSARYIMYYLFYIFVLQRPGSVNELIFYARRLDQPGRTKVSSSGWSHQLAVGLLVGPLGSWTSSLTSWLDCSELTSTRRSLAADQLDGLLGARFFANQLVGLFVASSSTTLGLTS